LEAIRQNQATRFLIDTRRIKLITERDQSWVNKEWVPRAELAGLRRLALITGPGKLGQASVANIIERFEAGQLRLSTFAAFDQAATWLALA
jgi:hypothetical protein